MKFKRFIALLTCFFMFNLLLFSNITYVKADNLGTLSYSFSENSIKQGDSFDINVNCNNVSDLYGASIDFKYDTSLIQVTGITKGSVFSDSSTQTPAYENDTQSGLLNFPELKIGNVSGYNVSSTSSIFVIHAKALKTGTITLNTISTNDSLSNTGNNVRIKLSDSNGQAIGYNASKQNINIANSIPVTIKSLTSDLASPQSIGNKITFTANASGGSDLLYQFWVRDSSGWKVARDYSSSNTFSWTPTSAGNYNISVYVKSSNSNKSVDACTSIDFNISDCVKLKSLTSDLASPQSIGNKITFTANASGSSNLLYQFWVRDSSGWKVARDYSSSNTFSWTPASTGNYNISVYVKSSTSKKSVDACTSVDFNITDCVKIKSLTSDLVSPQNTGNKITFTANASGGSNLLYQFWVGDSSGWKVARDYSSSNTFSWTPTSAGNYNISVYVKSATSNKSVEACTSTGFNIK